MKYTLLTVLIAICCAASGSIIVSDDFSAYTAGSVISNPNFNPKWDSTDTSQRDLFTADSGGVGYAVLDTSVAKLNYHVGGMVPFTIGTGKVAVISSDFRYNHQSGGTITSNLNRNVFGLMVSTTAAWNSGVNTAVSMANRGAAMGNTLPQAPWIEGWQLHSKLGVNTSTGGLSHWLRMDWKLTDTGTNILGQATISDLNTGLELYQTTQVDLGYASGTTLYAGYTTDYNNLGNVSIASYSKIDAVHMDNFIVDVYTPSVISTNVVADIDLTRKRSIAGISALDRETWFGVYHETGYGRNNFTEGATTMTFDEWINTEGRMWPSRGTVNFETFAEDPSRPSYVDPTEFSKLNGTFDYRYAWAKTKAPNHKTVLSGEGHGKYPAYMCWDPALTHNVKTVSNNVAHAEAVTNVLAQLDSRNGLMPKWFEVMNESSVQNNYGWHWDANAWTNLAEFHATVADAVHSSIYSNQVKVAGPTDAYPFRDNSNGDFSQWTNTDKKFIQLAGDRMDAYAIHTYEQMTTNSTGNSTFDDQFTVPEIWQLGRLPAFVDLWENEHHNIHGGTLPFVFSEYGLLDNRNPDGDRNAYYQIRSCNGILLSMLDRPDVVDKMSAFLMSQAPYNWNQKRVFFASEDSGATMYKTSYFEYLRFWHDLEGDYLFSHADSQHLALHAFLANNSTLYVVMKNNFNKALMVDVQAQLPNGASITSAQLQRIYYNGTNDVSRDAFAAIPVGDLSAVSIDPDETVMLNVQLASMPVLLTWDEINAYSDRTLVPMTAAMPEDFICNVPASYAEVNSEGMLHMSLYSYNGFSSPLSEVEINGTVITNVPDIAYTAGAVRSWKQIEVPVPAGLIRKGNNTVRVIPAEGGNQKKISSVRLTVSGAVGDQDTDGMPDWWELDNQLNPLVNDAGIDTDGDKVSNHSEYIAGTDPNDNMSYMYIQPASVQTNSGFRLAFPTTTNRFYAVEVSDSLINNVWVDLTNGIDGINDFVEVQDTNTVSPRFYRIRIQLP